MERYTIQYSITYIEFDPAQPGLNFPQYALPQPVTLAGDPESMPDFPRLGSEMSFQSGLDERQARWLKTSLAFLGIGIISFPVFTLITTLWVFFGIFSALVFWRGFLIFIGVCLRLTRRPSTRDFNADETLPIYTILVPLYQEAGIVPQLAKALSDLNWPSARLDVQILLESDDVETIEAAHAAAFPENTRLQIVPAGGPRTKPNALNFGLSEAFGQYITVYDAEDIPHPDQLQAAHQAFRSAARDLVCVQAPLIGDSRRSWLGAQWALEYAVQFGLLLPSLALYRMPLLIGGTSNHFRKDALRALGGWDSWNVTEDADLGMRIARAGLVCGTISPPTHEETPIVFGVWLAQRSRWIKGFIQTWLVMMRAPGKTLQQMGPFPFLIAQLCLGGAILAPLCHAPCVVLLLIVFVSPQLTIGVFGTGLLCTALLVGAASDVFSPGRLSLERAAAILTRPFYWPLHSIAAYRAIWELAKAPFFWAKTPHRPRDRKDIAACSTGLSASVLPPASSRWASSHSLRWEPSGKRISVPTNFPGD